MKQLLNILIILSFSWIAQAELSASTNQLLIDKLTNVFLKLPDGDPTKAKVTLRLADLHAEKGRLVAKEELEKGCIQCSNGEKDRKKALEYYRYVLPTLKGEQRQAVMVQVGHIYEVLGKNQEAIQFYQKVVGAGGSEKDIAESQFSLGEIYFKQRKYSQALPYYQKALKNSAFHRRGLASFRLAWCQYNSGQIAQAVQGLEKILTDPKLLTRGGEDVVSEDLDFKEEVAKDYTVFVAHGSQLNVEAIRKVYEYSPEKSKIENVSFLAKELERLGRIDSAKEAWEMVVAKTAKPDVRMEGLVYLAGLAFKSSNRSAVEPYLRRAFQNWQNLESCKTEQCTELKKRVRRLVFDWNRAEKKQPSEALIHSYEQYLAVAPQDTEAFELAAQAAITAKDYDLANKWLDVAYKQTPVTQKDQKETLLLRKIEVAELAKNPEWMKTAQLLYLKESPTQAKASEIRYQMAQTSYENKNYEEASGLFKTLATDKSTPAKLRVQSAEMALDTLVLLKQDGKIESWAREFAQILPKQRTRFLGLASQSVLSQTAKLSETDQGLDQAWVTLNRFDEKSASEKEKITFHRNRVILARKLKKFPEMNESLNKLLSFKALSKEDRQFALENKVWVSEVQLNFAQALNSYKELNTGKWLELARLADLAEKKSDNYYIKYISSTNDDKTALPICVKLIKDKKKIDGPLKGCVQHLQKDKPLFASLVLEIYSNQKSMAELNKILKSYDLDKTAVGFVVTRSLLLDQGAKDVAKLESHKLDGRSSRVAGSIKKRVALITAFEKTIQKATETKDWLAQTLFLTDLQKQYTKFYEDLLALPMPQGLSDEEQQEYLSILTQQAAPYKEKADQIGFKLAELWKNEAAIDQLYADFHSSPIEVQSILGPQIEKIRNIAVVEKKDLFNIIYRKRMQRKMPSFGLLETARQEVKRNPLDKSALQRLIELETQRGYRPMVIYLNSRLKMVDQGFEQGSIQ
ncbi:MAG: tetratricopeptide repeat protein [Bdellovibrionales bacterium]|nr:tetratricopeptide repeat protein [Bdellovibrionales bacterium]